MPGLFVMYAVITAGGPIDGEYARRAGTDLKALAPVRGRTMISRTIDALRECGIERIAVVGNDAVRNACAPFAVVKIICDAGSGAANVLGALDAWPDEEPLLYLTCDLPYIDVRSLQWFLDRIDRRTLSMPLVEVDAFHERFPGCPPFGITLAGERVVNGGVFHLPQGSRARIRALRRAHCSTRAKRHGRWRRSPGRSCWRNSSCAVFRFARSKRVHSTCSHCR